MLAKKTNVFFHRARKAPLDLDLFFFSLSLTRPRPTSNVFFQTPANTLVSQKAI